ncbi:class A beta-lactamase-related serine hydrolase [Kovacikia minuta CCNUW1]|uniref:serine hydrolase n=1 Tax=Kovacikia minuta TaxID=2931930 RepID=UPI001CC93911|nr:serine hydrolase [Kovacikia minuta]UBF28879.1 class A beta-lactamase-related serine hydrolase [Kovacikia minuta CCNUW1]
MDQQKFPGQLECPPNYCRCGGSRGLSAIAWQTRQLLKGSWNGHPDSYQQPNGSQVRGNNSPSFDLISPPDKGQAQSAGSKDKSSERRLPNFWNRLFGKGSRRTPAQSKRSQNRDATRSRGETLRSNGGERQSNRVGLTNRDGATNKPKNFVKAGGEGGHGSVPARSVPARDRGSKSPSLLQPTVHRGIRDRYNQLLPHRTNGSRSGGLIPGANRLPTQAPTQFNGADSRMAAHTAKRERVVKPRSPGLSAALYAARMVILSVGVGVLAGTMLSMWDPASRSPAGASQQNKQASVAVPANAGAATSLNELPKLGQEMTPLKLALQTLLGKNAQMATGLFFLDLDKNAYVDINGEATFSSASTIKVPILVAFFQDLDAGKIRLDEPLTLRKELIGNGSGEMQYQQPGTRFTALETVTKMITISDNTATNMVIARLGGMNALNQRFKSWGLQSTTINRPLPDLQGTNTTTPRDMALLMARISQGELMSMRSRDRMLDIMRQTENRSQLPQGLGAGATIAHKTGDIGTMIGDVGLIDLPNGKRYAAVVLVKRAFNDDRAYDFVSQISRLAYQYFTRTTGTQPAVTPTIAPATPSVSPTASPLSPTGQYSPSPTGQYAPSPTGESSPTLDSSPASGNQSEESTSEESTPN